MPAWLLSLLINAVKIVGIPYLIKIFPGLPAELWVLIENILNHVKTSDNPKQAVADLHRKVRECIGVACAMGLKEE